MTSERETPDSSSLPSAWTRFWLEPIPTLGMQSLRVLAGLLFIGWLASFLGHQVEIFSLNGSLDVVGLKKAQTEIALAEQQRQPHSIPPIGWSILYLAGENVALFQTMYFGSILVFTLFTLGIATRITAPLTWILVVSFMSNPATSYEADNLLAILAFYLMIGHLLAGQWSGNLSPLERVFGSRRDFLFASWLWPEQTRQPRLSHAANFMMRLLQIHVAIILVTSGLNKLQIADWWGGVALWYPLHPTFQTTLESLRQEAANAPVTLFFLSLMEYAVLAWLLAFPAFAWRTGWWRLILVGGALVGWGGLFFVFKLPLFGPFILLGCLSFLRPEEWQSIIDRLRSLGKSSPADKVAKPGNVPIAVAGASAKRR